MGNFVARCRAVGIALLDTDVGSALFLHGTSARDGGGPGDGKQGDGYGIKACCPS